MLLRPSVLEHGDVAQAYIFGDHLASIRGKDASPSVHFLMDMASCLPIDTVVFFVSVGKPCICCPVHGAHEAELNCASKPRSTIDPIVDTADHWPLHLCVAQVSGARASLPYRYLRLFRFREIVDFEPYYVSFITPLSTMFPIADVISRFTLLTVALLWCTHIAACLLHVSGLPEFDDTGCLDSNSCGWVQSQVAPDETVILMTPPVYPY